MNRKQLLKQIRIEVNEAAAAFRKARADIALACLDHAHDLIEQNHKPIKKVTYENRDQAAGGDRPARQDPAS